MSNDTLTASEKAAAPSAEQHPITAVDIVLEPDATMIQHAAAANAGLLKNFPKGYTLGDEHAPHISVIGGYFYTENLDEIFAEASKVLASEKVMSWKLKAFKYYYIPLKEIGLGGIMVQPTADLIRLQDELFEAIGKFWAPASSGSAAAFRTTPQDPNINQPTIDAVATYFSEHRGEHYSPHVTIGVGTVEYLNALLAASFPTFRFSAAGASAYQFGNFGTAAKLLHSFKLTQ
jgi:2'-5' RNA ligase superfamily